jgi:UDP-N-acetylmuramoylalanine--D-glutamate ligase
MRHLQDLHVLILGLGASGLAMARWCASHGAHVTVADTREAPPQLALLQAELPAVRFVAGPFSVALVDGQPVRAVYRSPGLSPAQLAPVLEAARAIGLPVGGELDLFAQALRDLRDTDPLTLAAEEGEALQLPLPAEDGEALQLPLPPGEGRGEGAAVGAMPTVDDDMDPALTPTLSQGER